MDTFTMLSKQFLKRHPLDGARILERQPVEEVAAFLEEAPVLQAAQVITIMDTIIAERCLNTMSDETCAAILAEISLDIAALYVRGMAKPRRESIVRLMPPDLGEALTRTLNYPGGTVGSIMDPLVFTVPDDLSVRDLLKRLRNQQHHVLDYVYVIDRENALIGYITLRDLMVADPRSSLSRLLLKSEIRISPTSSISYVVNHPGWSEFRALPVTDENGVFLGAIEHRTLRRLAGRESERKRGKRGQKRRFRVGRVVPDRHVGISARGDVCGQAEGVTGEQ